MRFSFYKVSRKKLTIIIGVLILIIFGIFLSVYLIEKEKKSVTVSKSVKELETIIVDTDKSALDIDKIVSYIYNHLPNQDDMLQVEIYSALKLHTNNFEHNRDQNALSEVDILFAELLSGLKSNNVDQVLGTFYADAYLDYINQFASPVEKEKALAEFVQTVNRKNTLQEAGIIKNDNDMSQVKMVLRYRDDKEIIIPFTLRVAERMYSRNAEKYVLVNNFEDILKYFD